MSESQNGWKLSKDFQIQVRPEGAQIVDTKKI